MRLLIWLASFALVVFHHFDTLSQLPPTVISKWGFDGEPTQRMSRDSFAYFRIGLPLFLNTLFAAFYHFTNKMPLYLINVPHKDYWTADQSRLKIFHQKVRTIFVASAIYLNIFLLLLNDVALRLNTGAPLWITLNQVLVFFVVTIVGQIIWTILYFRPPR